MSRLPTMESRQAKAPATRGEHPLAEFRREMDVLFDRFFHDWPLGLSEGESLTPSLWDFDIQEKENELIVKAQLPGFDEKDLDVRLEDNVLTIRAEKEEKKEGEQRMSRYFRSVALPSGIDPSHVKATYHDGLLELTLPRPEGSQGKRIPIHGAKHKAEKSGSHKASK